MLRVSSEFHRVAAAKGELDELADRGEGRPGDEGPSRRGVRRVAPSLAEQKRGDGSKGARGTGYYIDRAHVCVLLDTAEAAAESLHDAECRLQVIVVAEVGCSLASTRWAPVGIEAHDDRVALSRSAVGSLGHHGLHVRNADTEPFRRSTRGVHHEHIRVAHEGGERVAALSGLCIKQDRSFASVGSQAIHDGNLGRVAWSRAVHLGHGRAETCEHRADRRSCDDVREVDNVDAFEPTAMLVALDARRLGGATGTSSGLKRLTGRVAIPDARLSDAARLCGGV
mmetsp:Transcript_29957/g.77592  ORF Transcript_29957/g.77592 Transcript_29957/m.77592 type:complete len:283 (-) Transcript_29957:1170-2018(-)